MSRQTPKSKKTQKYSSLCVSATVYIHYRQIVIYWGGVAALYALPVQNVEECRDAWHVLAPILFLQPSCRKFPPLGPHVVWKTLTAHPPPLLSLTLTHTPLSLWAAAAHSPLLLPQQRVSFIALITINKQEHVEERPPPLLTPICSPSGLDPLECVWIVWTSMTLYLPPK